MENIKSTFHDLKLLDGRTVKVTLNYARLYALRAKNKSVYDKYIKVKNHLNDEKTDDFDILYIIYTAYLCANPESSQTFEEFIEMVPNDDFITSNLLVDLIAPSKKNEAFRQPSKKQRRK